MALHSTALYGTAQHSTTQNSATVWLAAARAGRWAAAHPLQQLVPQLPLVRAVTALDLQRRQLPLPLLQRQLAAQPEHAPAVAPPADARRDARGRAVPLPLLVQHLHPAARGQPARQPLQPDGAAVLALQQPPVAQALARHVPAPHPLDGAHRLALAAASATQW